MTLLVSDDFNRADTTTGLGTTSVGGKAWSRNDATFKIQSNRVQVSAGSGDPCTTVDAGQPNVTVQATLAVSGGDTSLVGRYTDDSNYWLAHMDSTGPVRLFKKVAGTYTQVSPSSGSGPNSGDVVQLVFTGNTVTMKVNGSVIFTTTDSFNNTATRAGFRAGTNVGGATWDDFSVATPSNTYSGTVLNDAPVAYWHLDEASNSTTLADASGNAHPLAIPATWTSTTSGVVGGGTALSMADSPGSINSPGAWATGLADFSVECWFKTTMTGSGVFLSMDDIGASPGQDSRKFNFYISGGTVVFMCFTNTGGYPYVQTAAGWNDGKWHHAVATRVGLVQTVYVDGVQRGTVTGSGTPSGANVDLLIGASRHGSGGSDQMFTGSLDEMALYGTGLSAAQVASHYAAASTDPYEQAVLSDAPLTYWRLNETSGTVTTDSSGNGHNGTYAASGVTLGAASTVSGTAVSFDGVAGEAYIPWASAGLSAYNANTGARYTIEFWAKTTKVGVAVGDPAFVCASDDSSNKQFVIGLGSGNGRVTTQQGATYAVAAGTKAVNDGAWHHIVVVFFSNRGAKIYVDGVEEAYTATGFDGSGGGTPNVRIGRNARNTYMPATMDEFALYAGELSATRVAAHYSAGAGTLSAPLSAAASLSAGASVTGIKQGVGALSATSSMTAGGYVGVTQSGATALSTTSSLSVAVVGTKTGAAALSATATLSATGTRVLKGTSALSAGSTLSVDATAVGYQAGDSTLTANATLVAIAGVVASGFTLVTYTYRPTSMNTDPISPNTYGTVVGGTDASVLWTPDGDGSYVEVSHDATASNPGTEITFRWEPVGDAAPADVSTWLSCAVSISHKQMSGPGTGWGSLDYRDPVTGNWGGNYGQDYSPGYPDVYTADGYVTQTQLLQPADLTVDGGFPHPVGPDTYWIYRMYGTYGTGGMSRLNYATLEVTALVPTPVPAEDWAPPTLEPNGFVTDTGATYLLGMMSGAEDAADTYYLAVTKTLPTPFSDGQDLDEPDATDYHRLAVPNGSGWGRLGASFYNEVALTFSPTSDWGTYLGWAVLDSAQEGRVLFAGDLVDAVTAVSGTPFTIDRGKLAVALAVTDWALEG